MQVLSTPVALQVQVQGRAITRASLGDLLSSPAVLAIVAVNFVNHWGYFIYLNWMPSFFYKVPWRFPGCCVGACMAGTQLHCVCVYTCAACCQYMHCPVQALGLDLKASSFLSLLPWVVMAVGSSAAGLLADALVRVRMPLCVR